MRHITDLRTLTAFVTVAREGNVTRAAEILHLTQPAVTLQLKRLSESCGAQLFRRTSRGLELTRDGETLAVKAEKVLSAMTEFDVSVKNLCESVEGEVRIGTIIDPDFIRLGSLLAYLTSAAPRLQTELVHGVSGTILSRLLRQDLDAGYFLGELESVAGWSMQDIVAKVHQQKLTTFSYFVVAPPGWDDRVRGKSWAELAEMPWIGTTPSSVHNRLLAKIFDGLGLRQRIVARVDQELSMLAMVRSGVGLSLCRDSLAWFEKQSNALAIADQVEIETTLSFLSLADRQTDPRIKAVTEAVTRVWSPGPHKPDQPHLSGPR
jgi:DNA-binding transcriptional LysR family regulator